MSEIARQRAGVRESRIWSPFLHSFPFAAEQAEERIILFGLYSQAYLNGQKYLAEIEAEDLLNLLADYNTKMSELDNQERIIVATVASKRYLAGIDKLIHDAKMTALSEKISAEDASWDAKMAALNADQAALATMAAKVTAETEKTSARITTLQSYIQAEAYELSAVDVQIAEKEIKSAQVDIEILNAGNAVLKIQAETVSKATELIELDMKKAFIRLNTQQQELKVAEINLLPKELEIQRARTAVAEAGVPVAIAQKDLAAAKSIEADNELLYQNTLKNRETVSHVAGVRAINHKYVVKSDDLKRAKEKDEFKISKGFDMSALDVAFAWQDNSAQFSVDSSRIGVINNRTPNAYTKVSAAIQAAEIMAKADVASTMRHTIGRLLE